MSSDLAITRRETRIPLWLKLVYTAFVAVLVPRYWQQYSPANFLWFCDVALLTTLVALWLESALLASMQAVAIVLPQILWQIDYVARLVGGSTPVNLSGYMFDAEIPVFNRGLSLFHGWLPFVLVYLVWRLGYDRRALKYQTVFCWLVLISAYVLTDGPNGPAGNINKVYGWADDEAQTVMPPLVWLACLMLIYPLVIYVPAHLIFCKLFQPPQGKSQAVAEPSSQQA